MAVILQAEGTEYIYVGITGAVPSVGAELAFAAAAARPEEADWLTAIVVDADHPLRADAVASGPGDWHIALLVGPRDGLVLPVGDWQVWVRITDTVEQPVRIAPTAVEVA